MFLKEISRVWDSSPLLWGTLPEDVELPIIMEIILILNESYNRFMAQLNKNDILKIQILKQFKKKDIDYTASYLSEILDSKYETVKKALDFFYMIDILERDIKEHGKKNITYYNLTNYGKTLLRSNKI